MERDTASLVTGKKGGREEEEGEIETKKNQSGDENALDG